MTNKELLDLYEGLRSADVVDGLQAFGHINIGSVDQDIKPLWRDVETYKHRICGFAFTVRFLPTNKVDHSNTIEEHEKNSRHFFNTFANHHPDLEAINDENILIFDCGNIFDWGGFGTLGALLLMKKGVRGMITNNSTRDSDEIIRLKFPLYCKKIGRGHRNFRSEYDACNVRINLGETLVCPGDMIVADGDGVVVVPIDLVEKVGKYARGILESDDEFIIQQGLTNEAANLM